MRKQQGVKKAVPLWVFGLAAVAALYLLAPLLMLAARVPWAAIPEVLASRAAQDALLLSLGTCLIALCVDLLLGVPLALVLSHNWRGVRFLRILVALPLSVPPVVAGLALLVLFGRRGPFGSVLDEFGWHIAFTPVAVVMAQVFVSLPFLVITLEAALRSRPNKFEHVAESLGARKGRVIFCVTLPLVRAGIARGSALALARCLGEFGATLTFAGSLQAVTRTMPLEVYLARESDQNLALVLGLILLVVALGVVALTEVSVRNGKSKKECADENERAERERSYGKRGEERGSSLGKDVSFGKNPKGNGGVSVRVRGEIIQRKWAVDFCAEAGEIIAIMGYNGAGKSTLVELLSGALSLDTGEIYIGDARVEDEECFVGAAQREGVCLGQDPLLFPHMTVLQNVMFPLLCRGVSRKKAGVLAREELRSVGCEGFAHRRVSELSGGQAARIALARALVTRPRLLLLDEPTAALDVTAVPQIIELLRSRVRASGATTIIVTHDIALALALAHTLVIFENGRIVESGPVGEVLSHFENSFVSTLAALPQPDVSMPESECGSVVATEWERECE